MGCVCGASVSTGGGVDIGTLGEPPPIDDGPAQVPASHMACGGCGGGAGCAETKLGTGGSGSLPTLP